MQDYVEGASRVVLVSNTNRNFAIVGGVLLGVLLVLCLVTAVNGSFGWMIIFAVAAILLAVFVVPRGLAFLRWGPAELHLGAHPLLLGGDVVVSFVQTSSASAPPTGEASVKFTLECEERATYTVGTDTRTDTSRVVRRSWPVDGSFTNGRFEAQTSVAIPLEGGCPTFDTGNNEVLWRIIVDPGDSPLPDFDSRFDVIVTATIASADRSHSEIQDAR